MSQIEVGQRLLLRGSKLDPIEREVAELSPTGGHVRLKAPGRFGRSDWKKREDVEKSLLEVLGTTEARS